jgi:hypothetical protein
MATKLFRSNTQVYNLKVVLCAETRLRGASMFNFAVGKSTRDVMRRAKGKILSYCAFFVVWPAVLCDRMQLEFRTPPLEHPNFFLFLNHWATQAAKLLANELCNSKTNIRSFIIHFTCRQNTYPTLQTACLITYITTFYVADVEAKYKLPLFAINHTLNSEQNQPNKLFTGHRMSNKRSHVDAVRSK